MKCPVTGETVVIVWEAFFCAVWAIFHFHLLAGEICCRQLSVTFSSTFDVTADFSLFKSHSNFKLPHCFAAEACLSPFQHFYSMDYFVFAFTSWELWMNFWQCQQWDTFTLTGVLDGAASADCVEVVSETALETTVAPIAGGADTANEALLLPSVASVSLHLNFQGCTCFPCEERVAFSLCGTVCTSLTQLFINLENRWGLQDDSNACEGMLIQVLNDQLWFIYRFSQIFQRCDGSLHNGLAQVVVDRSKRRGSHPGAQQRRDNDCSKHHRFDFFDVRHEARNDFNNQEAAIVTARLQQMKPTHQFGLPFCEVSCFWSECRDQGDAAPLQ
jgi:hypothetical protein